MQHDVEQIEQAVAALANGSHMEHFSLYAGITLAFLTLKGEEASLRHAASAHILEINYCRAGRVGWRMENGGTVYLSAGDYSLHTMDMCAHSVMTLPNEYYEGFALYLDLQTLAQAPPALLADTGVTGEFLAQKFCAHGKHASFAGTAQTASIFEGFYNQPEALRMAYWKIKTAELLLYLGKREVSAREHLADYQTEQVEIIRRVHTLLTEHIEQHFTIEALAKQFLINPTTLKTVFKAVYGNSIAAHTKEHRMEHAAGLLRETQKSIYEIAQAVGYENQSKFTAAFKEYYGVLPTDYRKQHGAALSVSACNQHGNIV